MNKKFLSAILFGVLMVTSTGTFVSCKDYDDDIDRLDQEISNVKDAIKALEDKVGSGKYVESCTPFTDGNGGYEIKFSDGETIKLYNGAKGEQGEPGKPGTPGTPGTAPRKMPTPSTTPTSQSRKRFMIHSFYVAKRAHRHSLLQTAGAPEGLRFVFLFCSILCRGSLFGSSLRLHRCSIVLAEQQTLVLVQLLLTAVQVNSNSSKGTGNSGQNSDHSDQTRFLHRFNTLLFSLKRCFSFHSSACWLLLYPFLSKITTIQVKKAKISYHKLLI